MGGRISGAFVFCALLFGCRTVAEPGESDVLRWYTWPNHPEPEDEWIEGTETIFGMEMRRADAPAGAVTIMIPPSNYDEERKQAWGAGWSCTSFVYLEVPADEVVLAHEIGHAFGLVHVDDSENLMSPELLGDVLTDQQIETVRTNAWYSEHRCSP